MRLHRFEARRGSAAGTSVELSLPVWRHPTGGSGNRLVERVVAGRREGRAVEIRQGFVVPEPVLAGLVALRDGRTGRRRVPTRVLRRRRVAAPDMSALRAAADVEPPPVGGEALD